MTVVVVNGFVVVVFVGFFVVVVVVSNSPQNICWKYPKNNHSLVVRSVPPVVEKSVVDEPGI